MVNLMHLLNLRTQQIRRARRKPVPIPTGLPETDAVFILLRRLRAPFIVLIVNFSVSTVGLTFMPGVDADGKPYYLTPFDAFYQMTMTVTTVGYTEAPYPFSYPQRMWVAFSIFILTISWAYLIGVLVSMVNDSALQDALGTQRFRRRVRHMREPFMLLIGYGAAGRAVGSELDRRRRRFVVVESSAHRIETIANGELTADVPALEGNAKVLSALGLAGLGHPKCEAVLALTDDDETNLAVTMSASLLRPDLPVIARCVDKKIQDQIEHFSPTAVINPDDRYGGYLALSLHQPVTHQLIQWLMDNDQHELPEVHTDLSDGKWMVAGECDFADAVAADLRGAGLDVEQVSPTDPFPSLEGVVGFVAASMNDLTNIAAAEEARIDEQDVYLAVRQRTNEYSPLLNAMEIDSVYISTELVAREVLARVLTPVFWQFVEQLLQSEEEVAVVLRDKLLQRCGPRVPERDVFIFEPATAPAACAWLESHTLTVGDLLRHPEQRSTPLEVVALMLVRDGRLIVAPPDDTELAVGDQLLAAGSSRGLTDVHDTIFHTSTVEYLATGHRVPTTWVWRKLARAKASAGMGQ